MRRLAITSIAVLGLLIMSAVPAFAGSPNGSRHVTVWATPDNENNVVVDGSFSVAPGTHGLVKLHLLGHAPNSTVWKDTSLTTNLNVVQGQTVYQFNFNTKWDKFRFKDYKVVSDDGDESRTIDRDECGFRVPEAPSSSLLLLGALPLLGVVGARVAGIRIPRPSWTRIG